MSTDFPIQAKSSELADGRGEAPRPATFEPIPSGAAVPYSGGAAWAGNGGAPQGGSMIARYLAVMNRYKWLILPIMVAGTAAGYFASRLVTPTYQVQARLWLDQGGGGKNAPLQEGQLISGRDNQAWLDLLTSYAVLEDVVIEQRLYVDRERGEDAVFANFSLKERFLPGDYRVKASANGREMSLETISGTLIEKVSAGDSLGRSIGFAWVPSPKAIRDPGGVQFTVLRPRDRARELASQLSTRIPKNGTFVHIAYTDTDPVRAAATLNGVIDRFASLAADLKGARLKEFATIFDEQLRLAQENLQGAEIALESFRVNTITQPSEAPNGVTPGIAATTGTATTSFITMKGQQEQLREDRAAILRALQRTSGISTAELEIIPSVQSSTELKTALSELATKRASLRALQYKYTDEFVDVKKLRGEIQTLEQETIPRLLRELAAELARREAQLGTMVASASSELRQIPPRVMEEARLSRQVGIADKIYTSLRQRHEEAQLASLSNSPDVRIVDRAAIPQKPLKDRSTFVILYGLGGSIGLIALGILLLDKFDRRVRFPEEITHGLRLPILAAIPRLKNANGNGRRTSENTSHVIEAFRGLRMTMLQERGNNGCLVTAVTSPGSGDGKSFVSVNLAFALADQGYRTLLIDGDIRRGGLHHFLGGSRKPGLTDYLAGNVGREEVIQSTSYPLLDLIASGRRLQTGPELLGSQTLREFVRELRNEYAVILIDTPPLGAGVDPFLLGMAAGNMVLVLRTGMSDMEFTEAKLNVLDRLPVRLFGAVMNGVPAGGAYRYYGYITGYETSDEELISEASRLPVLS